MGWLFTRGLSRKDLIKERVQKYEDANMVMTTLAYCVRGNCLWMVRESTSKNFGDSIKFIELDLLGSNKSDGWGYKDMEEQMHPYYYSCPLAYLEMVPVACEKWREGVRAYHEKQNRKIEVGATYKVNGLMTIRIASVRPLRGYTNTGKYCRFSKSILKEKIEEPIKWTPVERTVG